MLKRKNDKGKEGTKLKNDMNASDVMLKCRYIATVSINFFELFIFSFRYWYTD